MASPAAFYVGFKLRKSTDLEFIFGQAFADVQLHALK